MAETASRAVITAIVADVGVALAKFVAAAFTGSASMTAEGVHSLIDSADGLLLIWGRHRGKRPPDETHPFGHGKEEYFWTLIVALLIFSLGGGVTILEGVEHLRNPTPLEHSGWNYAVLAVALLLDGYSWTVALRQLGWRGGPLEAFKDAKASKDPSTFAVFFVDSAALLGIAVAFLGVVLSDWTGSPYPDGIASILIGLILAGVALLLTRESRMLLVGERADSGLIESLKGLAEADGSIGRVGQLLTMQMGSEEVLLNLDVQFKEELSAEEVGEAVDRLERAIREKHPEVRRIFIEAELFRTKGRGGEARTAAPRAEPVRAT